MPTPRAPRRKPPVTPEAIEIEPQVLSEDLLHALESMVKTIDSLRLSNGIVLKILPIAPEAVQAATMVIKQPAVPRVYIESDDRHEDNPDDPAYRKAMAEYYGRIIEVTKSVMMALGTQFEEAPEGFVGPDDDHWFNLMKVAGVLPEDHTFPTKEHRYMAWLKLYAMSKPTVDDQLLFFRLVQQVGIPEGRVNDAYAYFRGLSLRGANRKSATETERPHRPERARPVSGNTGARAGRAGRSKV